jgi:xanthine dehydrogenase accessory factor
MTTWVSAVQRLRRDRRPGVLVTVTEVRGHGPRDAGAKMVVSGSEVWGTIGGGNLEETALDHAKHMLDALPVEPSSITVSLNDKARTAHGRQCCGGEVALLFEPLPVVPSIAIFGTSIWSTRAAPTWGPTGWPASTTAPRRSWRTTHPSLSSHWARSRAAPTC